jgi:hypothetical protein
MKKYYTYLWLREDHTPYYVGKGHGNRAFTGRRNGGHLPPPIHRENILLQEYPTDADAIAAEIFLIARYGRKDLGTGILRNLTDGGDGTSGFKFPPEAIRKKVERQLGKKLKPHSEQSKQQTRNSLLGRKHTEARRRNQSLAHKGKPWTDLQRAAHPPKTHCKRGHLLTPDSVYLSKKNCRGCKQCQRLLHQIKRIKFLQGDSNGRSE